MLCGLLNCYSGTRPTVIALGIAAWLVQEGLARRRSTFSYETSGFPPLYIKSRVSTGRRLLLFRVVIHNIFLDTENPFNPFRLKTHNFHSLNWRCSDLFCRRLGSNDSNIFAFSYNFKIHSYCCFDSSFCNSISRCIMPYRPSASPTIIGTS